MINCECENRISDDEIISSLEVIATTRNCNEFKIRNCKWGTCNCSQITANAALDLIKRQKAEIEKLKGSTIVNNIMKMQRIKREAKVEAYIEFAKRLENEINIRTTFSREQDKNVIHMMNNLLKEMVGEEE